MPTRTSWRNVLAILILLATIGLFAYYLKTHPETITQIRQINSAILALLLVLYLAFTGALALVNTAAVKLCRSSIRISENILLTMYSAVINFFGPLQSGPAFRTIYLNKKHSLKVKDYAAASLIYYFFYAIISVILLFSGMLGWWLLLLIGLSILSFFVIKRTELLGFNKAKSLDLKVWYYMAGATLIQIALLVVIFAVELKTVDSSITISQVLIYTGAANLALFVSITPGAIGFREFFLVSTQRLHHIDNATIIAANTIDRAVYVLMLAILAVLIALTHGRNKLNVKSLRQERAK